ncbi:MAG: hypothetical protein IT436_18980 [Phycisphaerales bacterium]|nr:hypothetical protein [Phycisphaerales bacterium]
MKRVRVMAGVACASVLMGMAGTAGAGPCFGGLVTVPDTASDGVWAFSQTDGMLYSTHFIPYDGRMVRAKDAPCSRRDSVLVSDPGAGAILHYGFDGVYIGTVTDEASSGIADVRGLMVLGGQIYSAVGAGPWADTIQRFEFDGTGQATWASEHLAGPASLLTVEQRVYITNRGTGSLERFGLDGVWQSTVDSGLEGIEQVALGLEGGVLVGTARGIRAYDAGGALLGTYAEGFAVRGVFSLSDGEVLFTTADSVRSLDLDSGMVSLIADGGEFEYIQPIAFVPGPAGTAAFAGLAGLIGVRRRRER